MDAAKRLNDKHILRDKAKIHAKRDIWRGKSVQEDAQRLPDTLNDRFDLSNLTNNLSVIKPE
jgi:hypothetical protein